MRLFPRLRLRLCGLRSSRFRFARPRSFIFLLDLWSLSSFFFRSYFLARRQCFLDSSHHVSYSIGDLVKCILLLSFYSGDGLIERQLRHVSPSLRLFRLCLVSSWSCTGFRLIWSRTQYVHNSGRSRIRSL